MADESAVHAEVLFACRRELGHGSLILRFSDTRRSSRPL
jgi:hypothetical protein